MLKFADKPPRLPRIVYTQGNTRVENSHTAETGLTVFRNSETGRHLATQPRCLLNLALNDPRWLYLLGVLWRPSCNTPMSYNGQLLI